MCGMEYRLKKGSVYEGKVEKVDFPNKATVWVTDEDGQKEKAIVKNAIPGTDCQILREIRKEKDTAKADLWKLLRRVRLKPTRHVHILANAVAALTRQ